MQPPSLGDDDLARLRVALDEERTRLRSQLAGLERTFEDLVAGADVEPADDEHDPDGTTAYERAQITSLARITRARLAEVDAAIDATIDTTGRPGFGTCERCAAPIGVERMLARPGTTRCVRCAG
ncbi:MAG: TraR/DksA family transcriptional regulator [Acidimicrobiia bacterium]